MKKFVFSKQEIPGEEENGEVTGQMTLRNGLKI